jgi:hypothetical protein
MIDSSTLGIARAELKTLYIAEAKNLPELRTDVIGTYMTTTQVYERFKSLTGMGPAADTPEGQPVQFDDQMALFTRDFYPSMVTKGRSFTKLAGFTDQYGELKKSTPRFAKSFNDKRNIKAANLDNLGFTNTTDGMNGETLYSTAHSNGTASAAGSSNRPAVNLTFGPLAVQQCKNEIRKQRDARNTPMRLSGQILLKVPIDLQGSLAAVLKSVNLPGTTNNDINYARENVDGRVIDDYTSSTAWFARMADNNLHGLVWMQQMPYDIEMLPLDKTLMQNWVAWESYVAFWYFWYGTWGTPGA